MKAQRYSKKTKIVSFDFDLQRDIQSLNLLLKSLLYNNLQDYFYLFLNKKNIKWCRKNFQNVHFDRFNELIEKFKNIEYIKRPDLIDRKDIPDDLERKYYNTLYNKFIIPVLLSEDSNLLFIDADCIINCDIHKINSAFHQIKETLYFPYTRETEIYKNIDLPGKYKNKHFCYLNSGVIFVKQLNLQDKMEILQNFKKYILQWKSISLSILVEKMQIKKEDNGYAWTIEEIFWSVFYSIRNNNSFKHLKRINFFLKKVNNMGEYNNNNIIDNDIIHYIPMVINNTKYIPDEIYDLFESKKFSKLN